MKHFTRTAAGVFADTGKAVVALAFDTGDTRRARARSQAVRDLAHLFGVDTIRHVLVDHRPREEYRGLGGHKAISQDPRRIDLVGAPLDVARYLSALPRILDTAEAQATRCARALGRWLATVDGQNWVEAGGRTPDGLRYVKADFRAVAFRHIIAMAVDRSEAVEYEISVPLVEQPKAVALRETGRAMLDPLYPADEDEAAAIAATLPVIGLDETADPADVRDVLDAAAEVAAEIEQAPEARPVPAGLTVVPVPTAWRTWYAVDCIRCTGQLTKVVDQVATRDEAEDLAWDHYDARHRSADEALTLPEIDEAEALASALSRAQYEALWAVQTSEILEDAQGFYTYSLTTDAPVKVSGPRVVRLFFGGYLSAHAEGEHRRTFRLTAKGDRARRLLFRATRHGVVELGEKDGGLDVVAAKMRRYPFLAAGHPVRCGLLPEVPASAAAVVPDTVDEVLAAAGDQAPVDVVDAGAPEAAPVRELVALGSCARHITPVTFNVLEVTAPARAHRKEHPMDTQNLTPAQTKAVAAMRKNNGWAKKGGDVTRRTFGALVTKKIATWTINTPGGHWAGHLVEAAENTEGTKPDTNTLAQVNAWAAARNRYPAAHDFLYLSEDGHIYAWTFRAGLGAGAKIGWVAADGRVSSRAMLTRHDARLAAQAYMVRTVAVLDPTDTDAAARHEEFENLGDVQAAAEATHPDATMWQRVQCDGTTVAWTFRTGHGLDDRYTSILTDGTLAPSAGHLDRDSADAVACAHHQDHTRAAQLANAQDAVAGFYPTAREFEDSYYDEQMIGWTFRTGDGPRARYSWVTLAGTFGRGTEPYRSEAAALLPMAMLDDARVAARREQNEAMDRLTAVVEAQFPNAHGFRRVMNAGRTRTVAWTFRTGFATGAPYGLVTTDEVIHGGDYPDRVLAAEAAAILAD